MSDEVETVLDAEEVASEVEPTPAPEPVKPTPAKAAAKPATKKIAAPVASSPAAPAQVENESQPPEVAAFHFGESQLLLARRVAADAFEASETEEEFRKAFILDPRLDGTTDSETTALLVSGMECRAYWLAEKIDKPTAHVA